MNTIRAGLDTYLHLTSNNPHGDTLKGWAESLANWLVTQPHGIDTLVAYARLPIVERPQHGTTLSILLGSTTPEVIVLCHQHPTSRLDAEAVRAMLEAEKQRLQPLLNALTATGQYAEVGVQLAIRHLEDAEDEPTPNWVTELTDSSPEVAYKRLGNMVKVLRRAMA